MIANVDKETCTGCGLCAETCPEVFEMSDGLAVVKATPVPSDAEQRCEEAVDGCPVEAISIDG